MVGGMKLICYILTGVLVTGALVVTAKADERRFTYVYEPETLPAGAFEVENWVTLGAGRNATVGQEHYQRWDFRQELEYGVTDWYTAANRSTLSGGT